MSTEERKDRDDRPQDSSEGGFGFFRRYQKAILYTAGIFALVTFSMTGPLLGFFSSLFAPPFHGAKMTLPDGREIVVTADDDKLGTLLARGYHGFANVLPRFPRVPGLETESERERYAALRRLAVELGVEVSDEEVDRAIDHAVSLLDNIDTPTQLALASGSSSLAAYRMIVREAMRVGNFVRVQMLSASPTDADVAQDLLDDDDLYTLEVALFDEKAHAEKLKAKGVSDADLKEWLAGLSLDEKRSHGFVGEKRVSFAAAGFVYERFDAKAFQDHLKDKSFSEDELRAEYDVRKETFFKRPEPKEGGKKAEKGDGKDAQKPEDGKDAEKAGGDQDEKTPDPYRPFEEVKDEVLRMLQAEAVLEAVRHRGIQALMAEHLAAEIARRDEARIAEFEAKEALAKAEAALAEKPEDAAAKKAVDEAKKAVEEAEKALKAAEEALDAKRASFDFLAAMRKVLGERARFLATHRVEQPVDRSKLEDLGPLGKWADTYAVTAMERAGQISTTIQRTDRACFHFQTPRIIEDPLLPLEEIKDKAIEAYFNEKAAEAGKVAAEKLEKALDRLAREVAREDVAKLEKKRQETIAERFEKWVASLREERKQEILYRAKAGSPNSRIYKIHDRRIAEIDRMLSEEGRKKRREELAEEVGKEIDAEIREVLRKVYKDVIAKAAAEAGFELKIVGPYPKLLEKTPRFDKRFDPIVRFFFGSRFDEELEMTVSIVATLHEGEATEVLHDETNRARYFAVCRKIEKAPVEVLRRRQLVEHRPVFAADWRREALAQSFTIAALEKRYDYTRPKPEEPANKPVTEANVGGKSGADEEGAKK